MGVYLKRERWLDHAEKALWRASRGRREVERGAGTNQGIWGLMGDVMGERVEAEVALTCASGSGMANPKHVCSAGTQFLTVRQRRWLQFCADPEIGCDSLRVSNGGRFEDPGTCWKKRGTGV